MSFFHSLLMSGGSPTQTEAQIMFDSNLLFALEPNYTKTLRQEAATSVSLTPVTANDDLVGFIQDTSPYGHWIKATSATVRPKFGLVSNKASIKFDGTNDWMIVENSLGLFKNFWNATPTGAIMFKASVNVNGTTMCLFSSNDGTGGKTGIIARRVSSNIFQITITKFSPNVTILTYNSAFTWNVAAGTISVVVNMGSVGTNTAQIYINGILDGQANILAGVSQDASDLLRIGEKSASADEDFNGSLQRIYFLDRIATAAEIAWFTTYNPDIDTELFPLIEHTIFDFSNASKLYKEIASLTTNVSVNNDPVGTIVNSITVPVTMDLKRNAVAPSDAKRPLWKTNVKNGLAAGYWDGEITFQELNHPGWVRGGCYTHIIVEKFLNESAPLNEGRKLRSDGTPGNPATGANYMTQTGCHGDASSQFPLPVYGTSAGQGYFIQHIGGLAPGVAVGDTGTGPVGGPGEEAYNICIFVYVGDTCYAYNQVGLKITFPITGAPAWGKIGGILGTWTNNHICEDRLYWGIPGGRTSQIDAGVNTLFATLKTKWGIS